MREGQTNLTKQPQSTDATPWMEQNIFQPPAAMSLAFRPTGQPKAWTQPETRKPQKNLATTHNKTTWKTSSLLDPPIKAPKLRTTHPATTVRHHSPPISKPPENASNPDPELYLIQSVNEAAPEVPVTGDPAETGVIAMEEGYRRELWPSDPKEANPNLKEPSLIGW